MSTNTASATTSKPKVVNPYAKKKSSAPSTAPAPAPAPAQQPKLPPPVDPSSTFSQAFGDYQPDANFCTEERSEQLKFDQALLVTEVNGSVATANASTAAAPKISDRDNQQYLAPHVLHVSLRQRGNPVLNHIRNVPYQESQMVPDYIFAPTRCALYLSIRYHNLHPDYIKRRMAELKSDFDLRILLLHVDVDDNAHVILALNTMCVHNNFTLILAWSEEEAARYLETFKAFDGKDASLIQKREHTNYPDQIAHVLGSVRSVNKTDASQLLTQFGTWKNLVGASVEELSVCPGVGVKKVRRLYEAFHRPFTKEGAKRRREKEKAEKLEKEKNSAQLLTKQTVAVDTEADKVNESGQFTTKAAESDEDVKC
eukprot:scaffold43086_cov53-Cyclotella_meneghiniana.AAC.6